MFVLVPEPVWKMSIGKCSSSLPSISLLRCLLDVLGLFDGVELTKFQVGAGCRQFDQAERAQVGAAKAVAADGEIENGSLGS